MINKYLYYIQESESNIVIKELPTKDYKILESLYKEFVIDTSKKTTHKYKNKTLKTKINEITTAKKYILLVAYDKDLPVGFIFGSIDDKQKTGKLHGAIRQLVVSKKYRNKGIAKNLWFILNKWLDKNNADIKWVTVLSRNNEAVGLYKSLGFIPEMITMRI